MKVLWDLEKLVHTTVSVKMAQTMCNFEDVTSLQDSLKTYETNSCEAEEKAKGLSSNESRGWSKAQVFSSWGLSPVLETACQAVICSQDIKLPPAAMKSNHLLQTHDCTLDQTPHSLKLGLGKKRVSWLVRKKIAPITDDDCGYQLPV